MCLGETHRRHLLSACSTIDRRLGELEAALVQATRPGPFSGLVNDVSPVQAKVVLDHFARLRGALLAHLKELEIRPETRETSVRWVLQSGLTHLQVSVDDMGPTGFAGYGTLVPGAESALLKLQEDLTRLLKGVLAYLRQGSGRDLAQRLSRLETAPDLVTLLTQLEHVITRWGLIAYRPRLDMVLQRLESPCFEVAVFGRVSSGKSSFLNHVAGLAVLPVGVLPVTAVPTTLVRGDVARVTVSFAESGSRVVGIEDLWEYATEEGNSGNHRHVTGIHVEVPSVRLSRDVAFVDTPGIGALALAGASEAVAYLPRCDLGIVLIDAGTALGHEDLGLLQALAESRVASVALLSKADLLSAPDRARVSAYAERQIRDGVGLDVAVIPVSTVGPDRSLLDRWYEEDLRPRLQRHQDLADASIRRKIAVLREGIAAALEERLAELRGREQHATLPVDPEAAQQVLQSADESARETDEILRRWSRGRADLAGMAIRAAASAVIAAPGGASAHEHALRAIQQVLIERGQVARSLIARLSARLDDALTALNRGAAEVESESDGPEHGRQVIGSLPLPDVSTLGSDWSPIRPWWADACRPLALRLAEHAIDKRAGAAISDVVGAYDRALEQWARLAYTRLVARFENHVEDVRDRLRRGAGHGQRS
jgi:GTPase Era involved in 16S rRNA processing